MRSERQRRAATTSRLRRIEFTRNQRICYARLRGNRFLLLATAQTTPRDSVRAARVASRGGGSVSLRLGRDQEIVPSRRALRAGEGRFAGVLRRGAIPACAAFLRQPICQGILVPGGK